MSPDEVERLQQRVANGITWLVEHDPLGRFHLWFTAKLTPYSVMPAKNEEEKAAYREYYNARVAWERLDKELARVDPQWQGGQ